MGGVGWAQRLQFITKGAVPPPRRCSRVTPSTRRRCVLGRLGAVLGGPAPSRQPRDRRYTRGVGGGELSLVLASSSRKGAAAW